MQENIDNLLTVKVFDDLNPCNPRDWDNVATLVCWHKCYTLGDEQPTQDPQEWLAEYQAANPGALILPLFMYEHSGISLSLQPFGCRWDSGQVGWAVVTAETIAKEWPDSPTPEARQEKALACARAEVEEYSAYVNGDCYGYQVIDQDGEVLESCGGYFDQKEALYAGKASAQALLPEAAHRQQAREKAAALHAAAPELLAALEELQAYASKQIGNHGPIGMWSKVREAINKAKGE